MLPSDACQLQRQDSGRLRHGESGHLGDLGRRLAHAFRVDSEPLGDQQFLKRRRLLFAAHIGIVALEQSPNIIAVFRFHDDRLFAGAQRAVVEALAVYHLANRIVEVGRRID